MVLQKIYDFINLKLKAKNYDDMKCYEPINYIRELYNGHFLISGGYILIFIFYLENTFSCYKKNLYKTKLLQKIVVPDENFITMSFQVSFLFDKNLYKKYDIYEMGKDTQKNKNIKAERIDFEVEKLIINTNKGILIFIKTVEKDENINDNENINKDKIGFDINSYLEKWNNNSYKYKGKLSGIEHYDIVQVNFKYIAGAIKEYLNLYYMETEELVTKFKLEISDYCYKTMCMLTSDILCVGGNDKISLISIKDFEIILISIIKLNYLISEICLLPNNNILIGILNVNETENDEYLYQYKYYTSLDKSTKKIVHNFIQVNSELFTTNGSEIIMDCLNNELVTIVGENLIITWDLIL